LGLKSGVKHVRGGKAILTDGSVIFRENKWVYIQGKAVSGGQESDNFETFCWHIVIEISYEIYINEMENIIQEKTGIYNVLK
jgi:hypothetical protein